MFLNPDGDLLSPGASAPDLEQFRRVEEMIRYANSHGITVWINAVWGKPEVLTAMGADSVVQWWRYVVDRLAAYNVVWVLANEYNMGNYGGLGLDFWRRLGRTVRAEDPYGHIIGVHSTPPGWQAGDVAPQWSTADVLQNESWLDFNQSQVGHAKWRNEMIPSVVVSAYDKRPRKPIVVTEPWYEFVLGSASARDIRFGAWSAFLSGAAGHSYGGGRVWFASTPDQPDRQAPWPLEGTFDDSLNYPGVAAVSFMAKFLKAIDWWRLVPHPEVLSNNPSKFCSAIPGREYVIYLRWGGVVDVDLRPSSSTDVFTGTWTDLVTGKTADAGDVNGGGVREFPAPEQYPEHLDDKDWLLFIRRKLPPAPKGAKTGVTSRTPPTAARRSLGG
jgi:hypothetical protein